MDEIIAPFVQAERTLVEIVSGGLSSDLAAARA
jgi:hypothetical protein